jgi:hypothetical protein
VAALALAYANMGCPAPAPYAMTHEQIDLLCHRTGEPLPPDLYGLTAFPSSEAPPGTAALLARDGHSLLDISPHEPGYKMVVPAVCLPSGEEAVATVRVCVNESGNVTQVLILQSSLPLLTDLLPSVLGRWRYRPYLVDGQPVPFCYHFNYRVLGRGGG